MAVDDGAGASTGTGAGAGALEQSDALWPGDAGTLPFDARRALLSLIKGPYITAERNGELYRALLNSQAAIESRLNDLFLELVVDDASGIAFVKNVTPDELKVPSATRSQPLTILDTAMVLMLRRELVNAGFDRVIIGKEEFLDQMAPYRPIEKTDESGFAKVLERSWGRLRDAGFLQPTDNENRWEISPVLRLVFGNDEVRAVQEEFDRLLQQDAEDGGDEAAEGAGAELDAWEEADA